ncbi:MAG: flavodoxin domain-containing protein [Coprobacillaceae bacterium]
MKTLIVYASKSGATKECATLLQKRISNSLICDVSDKSIDIMLYDSIILGTEMICMTINSC